MPFTVNERPPEVRFDGRPFEYRRPSKDNDPRHSYDFLNPLYKYSEGRVRDVALQLGITNVHQPDQAKKILTELQRPYAPAPTEAEPEPPKEEKPAEIDPVIDNPYQSEIDNLQKQLDDRPDFTVELARIQQDYQSQIAAQATQQRNYLNNLQIQQNTRLDTMAADQQRRSDELAAGQRTYQQNQARSSQLGALQIGGAAETPRTGGTQGFKRRKLQINPATANALSGILGGTAAATKTNVLNV